jgi:lipopolysaccharide export system permease protein
MRILTRYVLTEFLVPLFYCLTAFLGLYVVLELFDVFDRITKFKPSASMVFSYFAGFVTPFLEWIFAASLLLATLYTLWQLCRHSEVVAMRANGLGFGTIVAPILAVAVILAVLCALNSEFYAPKAAEYAKRIQRNQFKPMPPDVRNAVHYYHRTDRRVWSIDTIDASQPAVLEGVRITKERPDGSRIVDIRARRAEYLDGIWWLTYPQYTYYNALNQSIPSPTPELENLPLRSMPELTEAPLDFINESKDWSFFTLRDMFRYLKAHPGLASDEVASRHYDIHYRLAAPWSCLIITLFAIPAGVATGRQSVFNGVLMAIGLFFGFYAAVNGCMILAKREVIAPWLGAWLPNFGFLIAGGILFWRQR